MSARLHHVESPLALPDVARHSHLLIVLPAARRLDALPPFPLREVLEATLKRRGMKFEALAKTPVSLQTPAGGLAVVVMRDGGKSVFERHCLMRRALAPLQEEQPRRLAVAVFGGDDACREAAAEVVYCAEVNAYRLPQRKGKVKGNGDRASADKPAVPLAHIDLYGPADATAIAAVQAAARGNSLARELTALPPNELTPRAYRGRLRAMARKLGWQHEEWDMKRLRKIGAGAFVAVAQGSPDDDAAIVRLSYDPRGATRRLALVGKGICFDTGGHNLKSARYMSGMHEDMNGSAVALGLLQALAETRAPVRIDCWLAIAANHLSPAAYTQNAVVTALDGTTIEVVHTDAEGRMVLADTLALAAREAPQLMLDFATLTGSMITVLGSRMSGVFASDEALAGMAVEAGRRAGERVAVLPMEDDYDTPLESKIADVKQCLLDGEADHIYAARFLRRFTHGVRWLHMDLSAVNCSGGLGAVGSDLTGFGVGWGLALVQQWLATSEPAAPAGAGRQARKG